MVSGHGDRSTRVATEFMTGDTEMAQRTASVAVARFNLVGVHVLRALLAGLIGTAAMTILTYGAQFMGFPRMDIATLLGTMFIANPAAAFLPGLAMNFMIGLVLALRR